ncbi:hypothetical protein [Bradyrhizobium sp. JR3.5]
MPAQSIATELENFTTSDFRLENGSVLGEVTVAYRTVGTLAPNRDNVVLITHGNTSGPQMIDPGGSTGEGSWNEIVGPGKAVDTNRYFAICPNMLGIVLRLDQCGEYRPADRPALRAALPGHHRQRHRRHPARDAR